MKLLALFFSFLQIGLFSVGGGYAAMPLIQAQTVTRHGWITLMQFADLVTIAEMTPGPIAVNAAAFVGIQAAGLPGALAATLGCILPSCLLVSLLAYLYRRFHSLSLFQTVLASLRPVITALIAGAGASLLLAALAPSGWGLANVDWIAAGLFALALFALRKWKASPILMIFLSGGAGLLLYGLIG